MIDFNSLLYDPIYQIKGVAATLASSGGATISIKVIDETQGVTLQGDAMVETIGPSCRVRVKELAANSVALTDLDTGSIEFNGASWRIKSHRMMPNANGENDGQVRLMLLSEG